MKRKQTETLCVTGYRTIRAGEEGGEEGKVREVRREGEGGEEGR